MPNCLPKSDNWFELLKNLNSVESFASSCQLSRPPTKCQRLASKRKDSINDEYFIDARSWTALFQAFSFFDIKVVR